MKTKIAYLLLAMIFIGCSKEETTPEPEPEAIEPKVHKGNIDLMSQGAVEEFAKEKYTVIDGGLYIGGPENDITSIESLNTLQEVGNLIIQDTQLKDLEGLNNLIVVHQDMEISVNSELESVAGFDNLVSVGNHLNVSSNPKLIDFSGFKTFHEVHSFQFISNESLVSLVGFEKMKSVGYHGGIHQNTKLVDFCGLQSVSSQEFFLEVHNNGYNPTKKEIAAGNCKL